jgi:hypothetical protein
MSTQTFGDDENATAHGFLLQDILWSIGIWAVLLGLSPAIVFYILMVN